MKRVLTAKPSQFELWTRAALFRACQPKIWAKHQRAARRAERDAYRAYFEGYTGSGAEAGEDERGEPTGGEPGDLVEHT